jgi:hypothetical protein
MVRFMADYGKYILLAFLVSLSAAQAEEYENAHALLINKKDAIDFLENKYGGRWKAKFHGEKTTFTIISGSVDIGEVNLEDEEDTRIYITKFLEEITVLTGISREQYQYKSHKTIGDKHIYKYIHIHNNAPVHRSFITVMFRNSDAKKQISIINNSAPINAESNTHRISENRAIEIAELRHRNTFQEWNTYTNIDSYPDLNERERRMTGGPTLTSIAKNGNSFCSSKVNNDVMVYRIDFLSKTYFVDLIAGHVVCEHNNVKR